MGEGGKTGTELREEAARWLVALDCGTADAEAFEAWRRTSPYHASAFAQAAALWRSTGDRRIAGLIDQPVAEAVPVQEDLPARGMSRRAVAGGAFAALLGLGGLGGWLAMPGKAYAATGVGEQRSILLPDGSHAMLNTDSKVSWRFGRQREFWIEQGEAALTVRPDTAAFMLHSDPLAAELGRGSFNLRLVGKEGHLLVQSGQARLDTGEVLAAGQMATAKAGGITIGAAPADQMSAATAWQQGKIVFNGMPLGRAIAEFNRYLPGKIVLQDADLGETRLGGEFRVDDPDRFLAALASGFDIAHRQQGNQILLYRKPSGR